MVWPISTSVITSLITHTYHTVSLQMDQYWQPMALLYANVQVCCIKPRILSTDPRRYVTVNFACYSLTLLTLSTQNVYFCLQTAVRTPPHPADERDSYRGRNAGV